MLLSFRAKLTSRFLRLNPRDEIPLPVGAEVEVCLTSAVESLAVVETIAAGDISSTAFRMMVAMS